MPLFGSVRFRSAQPGFRSPETQKYCTNGISCSPNNTSMGRQGLQAVIQFFFQLCLLRKAPQDLPGSSALLAVTLLADLLVGMALAGVAGLSPGRGLLQGLVDVAFMLALLYGAVHLLNRIPRFQQAATALLGSGAVLGFIAAVPLSMLPRGGDEQAPGVAVLLFLGLIFWSVLVTGHILRHTFDLSLRQGVGIAIVYSFFAYSLVGGIFSGT